ncbi:MAG: hypothetical protein OXN27_16775 [Candidatus Poribacteria bacterium]|nr:hypothetical protein [Candidatus Poribacteria bacterium]
MTKSKRFVAFVIFPLLFLSVIIFGIITSEMKNVHTSREGHHVNSTGHLTVETEFGTINIETANRNHVDIATRKEWKSRSGILRPKLDKWVDELFEDFEITIEYDPPDTESDVRIGGKFKRGREYWQDGLKWFKVEIQVTVPRQYDVTLKTTSRGDIHVGDLIGTVKAKALGGNIHLGEIQGEVWGETGVSGDITLKGGQSSVNLTVATGDIRAEMTMQPQHPWTLQALLGGAIDVTLGPHIAIDIDAQTQGKISSDFSIQPQDEITENLLKGTLNGGGPLLKLHASTGEIRLQ